MTDPKILHLEDSLKEKHLSIVTKMSISDLKKFKKHEYKKTVLNEFGDLLPEYNKKQYDQTAQCVVNFLYSEVQSLIRNPATTAIESQEDNTILLSDTVLQDLDSTMQPDAEATDTVDDVDEQIHTGETMNNDEHASKNINQSSTNLDDSITHLKTAANAEKISPSVTCNDKAEPESSNKSAKCCDTCKVKPSTKKRYDQIQCTFCMCWFHETCVGIKKGDPIGIWVCISCRNVPKVLKNDIDNLKHEVVEIKKCTQSVFKAIEVLSTKFENTIGGIKDQMTTISRQMNSKELCITESIENLQTTTNNLKTSLDQKACKILNKTEAVFEKVKSHSENMNNLTNTTCNLNQPKVNAKQTVKQINKPMDRTKHPANNTNKLNPEKSSNPSDKPRLSRPRPNSESLQNSYQSPEIIDLSNDSDNPIDPTGKKHIKQSTLLVGSSILKGVRTNELKPNTTARSFPGATTETLKEKLRAYNLESCKTIILHVGGNDADDGKDLETFCDDYISLLETLVEKDRRIIVSGLLPRKNIDLKPYNDKLKSLCEVNNIEFANNFDNFLFASGEIPATYFGRDKIHLNVNGTKKLLSNIDKLCKVTRPDSQTQTLHSNRNHRYGGGRPRPQGARGPRTSQKYCHICSKQGHSTQECYYNGKITGTSRYSHL